MKLICLGGSRESAPIVAHLRDLGYETIVVDQDERCAAREYAGQFIPASCYDARKTVSALLAARVRADGVLCCAIDAPHVAAEVARVLALPGLTPEQARLSVDKYRQNLVLREAGLCVPATRRTGEAWQGDVSRARKFVVKPVDLRGGRGVLVLGGTQFEDAQRIRRSLEQAQKAGGSGALIQQEWIEGTQYSTESIVKDGKVIFTAVATRNYSRLAEFYPYVIEDGSDTMTNGQMTNDKSGEINALVERACAALGWDNLTVKGDWVVNEGQRVIIELAARLSGGYFASAIIPAAYGVDLIGAAAALAVRQPFKIESGKPAAVCQRYIFPDPEDIGRQVTEVKAPKLNGEIVSATLHVKSGDRIRPVISHTERWGQVVTASDTIAGAQKFAVDAVKKLKAGVRLA